MAGKQGHILCYHAWDKQEQRPPWEYKAQCRQVWVCCIYFSETLIWMPLPNPRIGFRLIFPIFTFSHLNSMKKKKNLIINYIIIWALVSLKREDWRRKMYLYLVSKTWKNVAMKTLLYSAPAHCRIPPPKGMKFFDTTCDSSS